MIKYCSVGLSNSAASSSAEDKNYLPSAEHPRAQSAIARDWCWSLGIFYQPAMAAYRADAYFFRKIRFAAAGFDRQPGQREWRPQWH